jgi:hypothetical protein
MSTVPVPPAQPGPPPLPQRQNNAVWWILGIVGGCILLFIVAGLTLAGLFLRRVNVRNSGNSVDIQTPVGEFAVNKSEHATGLPVYPGATKSTDDDSGGSANISFGDQGGLAIAAEAYVSSDSEDKIKGWYADRLGPNFRLETGRDQDAEFRHAKITVSSDQDLSFVDDRGGAVRLVALKRTAGGVKITLVRFGKRETQ